MAEHYAPASFLKRWSLLLACAALCVTHGTLLAQPFPIFNGTASTCTGAFLDSGGQGASGYSNNESFTYTLCPSTPGGAISLTFLTFNLSTAGAAPIDYMTIYDGSSTAAPQLANWTGTGGQGQIVSASASNPTGCLTIVFRSNATGTGVFAASITCYQPCIRPTAAATHGPTNPMRICPGQSVTFNSSASTAAAGNSIVNRRWDFGDGTVLNNAPAVVSHTYAQPGGYMAQLTVFDNNGCASTNQVDLLVLVGTPPTFNGTGGTLTGCVGETLCLTGAVQGTPWTETPNPNLGGGVFLPDNVGECFESTIFFDQFPPGATLTNVNGLLSICMQMEHSFMGDLIINIISPTGQTVTMHQQGGGATYLGIPVDNDLTPNVQGTCWNYCFSPTATNGTWVANSGGTLPAGTYQSLNPLAGLVGSQLNGGWTIQICDMWASDNGFLCNWSIDFAPSLFADLISFTPVYGAQCDSSYWTGPSITSTNANCNQICVTPPTAGNHTYTYHVTDNFGCTYTTPLTVNLVPAPQVNAGPDASTCNTPVQLNATVTGGGFPTNCNYTLTLYDSFGDGWTGLFGLGSNGSSVTVTVNGTPYSYWLTGGSQASVNIPVTSGATIVVSYVAGSLYNGEQSFTLFNGAAVVYASPMGPGTGQLWSGVAACPGGGYVYSWSPAAGLSNPNSANPTATVGGTTQYCVTVYQVGHPACTTTDCMTITVDNLVNPGSNASVAACSNGAAINLFAQLGGTPTAGGIWSAPGGGAHSGTFQPGADAPGIYTYTVGGAGACGAPQSSTVSVTVHPLPNAGTNSGLSVCSTDAAQSLFALLGGSAQAGGTWSGPSPVVGGSYNPATMTPGVYTYMVNGTAPCPNASATITVTESTPPNAGNDASITLCSTSAPVVLVTQLGGNPDGTGTWTAPGGGASSGGLNPAVDPPGVYTYTVTGTAPCPNDVATLTVAINQAPNAGTNGSITLCATDAPASLFAQLGGAPQVGGTWSGPSPVVGGMIDPATMSAGTYTYTVNGTAPCPSASATVSVTINAPPDAGTNGSITLCATDAPASLFAQLGGTPQAGGTWSGPSPVVGGMIDPATMNAGVYTYTVNAVAPCPSASATVNVTINAPPDAGTNGSITLCATDAPASLLAQLGGAPQAGGSWSGPSAVVGGMIDPATMSAGNYTYTVNGTAPCPSASAMVNVTINAPPDAGTNGSITLCATDAPASLFAQLGGTPQAGGTWSGPSPVVGGMIDPATMSAGAYTYTVNGTAPCPSASAMVNVTINAPPDAGTNGSITLCATDAPASLFAQLGGTPQAGGTWSGPSPVAGGMIDPATMSAGVYTYTVNGTAPCPSASAMVSVAINAPPDAGTNGSITLCATDAPASLLAQLGGVPQAGGTWSGPSPVVGGMIDPATMSAGNYTYTVNGTAPCPSASAMVNVTINAPPDAGTNGSITLCATDAPASLFAQLGGTPQAGGTWSGPSPVVGGMIDPATMSAGNYTYTVNGTAPCPSASAMVNVTINAPPDAGTNGSITLCATDAPASLFAQLGGTPQAGGTWSGPSPVAGGMIDPATMSAGVYTYTVNGTAPCPSASATVSVAINAPPDAGTNGSITLCATDAPASLFAQLGGAPQAGGTWSGPSPVVGGMIDPATMSAGAYTYTVNGVAPCPAATAIVNVIIHALPNAGINGGLTLCSSSPTTALASGLNGTPDPGGMWTAPGGGASNGTFTPGVSITGSYMYTVSGMAPCPSASATVDVSVVTNPDAGLPGNSTLCATDTPILLFNQLGGTPDAGGAWTGPSPVVGGLYDPATMSPGVYTYTIAVPPPCVNASSTVTITEVAPPNAGTDGALTLCISSPAASLFAQLGGGAQTGGTWSGPSPVAGGMFDPATMSAGTYTYTVNGTAPCPADQAQVTVSVVAAPDAGTPGSATLCATDAAISLFAQLGGTPDAGGAWTGPSPVVGGLYDPATMSPGVYTYTIAVPPPCVNASSTVTITEVAPPNAGTDGALTLCISSPAASLFAQLGGGAQTGGTWSGPSPVAGGMFDPATMSAGTYTYTVNGTAPCPADQAQVTVSVVAAPDAGTPGSATLCATDAAISLFAQLGGTPDAGGAWTGPSPVVGGLYNPTTMNPGVYTYTIAVPPPCVNASSTVTITEVAPPNAGTDGALTLCISSPAASLFAQLGGGAQAGGSWSGPSPVAGGMFDPATMSAGTYTYTVNGTAPCPADQAQVTVSVVAAPNAGTPGSATLCATDAPILLFNQLGGTPDAGGAWTGPSPVVGGLYDPATMSPGVYAYTIAVPPPCVNASSTVTITEMAPPNAGTGGSLTLCISSPAASLFAQLGGGAQAGGSWSGPSPVAGGMFDPATMSAGTYTYTVNGTAPCPADQAQVTVSVVSEPDPGGPGFLTICATDAPDDLFSYLEGSPDQGGLWTTPSGGATSGVFDPATMPSGVYTYTIAVPPPCASVSSTVTVDVIAAPNAGLDGAATLCLTGAPLNLFGALGGAPQAGGTWSTASGASFSGTFNPASDAPGVYTYTVNGTAPCPADAATVTIAVTQLPYAGTDAILNLCVVGDAVDLFTSLGSADIGGTWSGPGGGSSGVFTPGLSAAGSYTYTVTGAPPCPSASATVTVNVLSNADAGGDGAATLCGSDGPVSLFGLLQGSPDAGGAWFAPDGTPMGGTFNPALHPSGAYTYILYVPAPCENDTAQVAMEVVAPVSAGSDGSATFCSNSPAAALFTLLGGSPDAGGNWSAPNGAPTEGSFNPGSDASGGYVYTVLATAPCPNQSATVTVDVNPLPDAGTSGSITLCPEASPIPLFSLLGGTPWTGGTWTGPNGQPSNGIFDPASTPQGTYTYTVSGLAPCPNATASSTATVFLIAPPNAGPDAVTCTLDYTLNATGSWASGTWSGPPGIAFADPASPTSGVTAAAGGTYTMTWSVISSDGCATQDQVAITFTDAIIPVVAATDAICNGACNGTASVQATGGNGAYTYAWSNGIAGNTPTATGICAGGYTVTVFDVNNCSAVAPFTIGQPEALVIDAIASVNETCPGSCDGSITITDPQGAQYSINGGTSYQTGSVFTNLCPGEYAIVMMDANGCTASGTATIIRPAPVVADFDYAPETLFVGASTADFTNTSSPNAVSFAWDFAGIGSSTAASPAFTFPGALGDTYMVCLTAYDANSCADTHCEPIAVLDALVVWVPNTFTPNGDDENDRFMPVFNLPHLVKDYEFMVFDRWGLLLSQSERVHEPWDGAYRGEIVQEDVYVWKMKCKNRLTNELIERVGHVTVLK